MLTKNSREIRKTGDPWQSPSWTFVGFFSQSASRTEGSREFVGMAPGGTEVWELLGLIMGKLE